MARVYMYNCRKTVKLLKTFIIMSHTHFRVNPHSIVTWMPRNSLLKTGAISVSLSDCIGILTHNHSVCKRGLNHLTKLVKWWINHLESSTIWPVRLSGWVFVYELSCCWFEPWCSHFTAENFPILSVENFPFLSFP